MTAMRVSPQLPRLNWTASFDHLSARASTVAGSSRPSAFAALRLITVSYLTGACTGRSPGFSPLRMRSRPRGAAVRSHQFHRRSGRHWRRKRGWGRPRATDAWPPAR